MLLSEVIAGFDKRLALSDPVGCVAPCPPWLLSEAGIGIANLHLYVTVKQHKTSSQRVNATFVSLHPGWGNMLYIRTDPSYLTSKRPKIGKFSFSRIKKRFSQKPKLALVLVFQSACKQITWLYVMEPKIVCILCTNKWYSYIYNIHSEMRGGSINAIRSYVSL